jgi:hypothetical protein
MMFYPDNITNRLYLRLVIRRNLLKNLAFIIPSISFSQSIKSNGVSDCSEDGPLTRNELDTMKAFILAVAPESDDYCDSLISELGEDFYGFTKQLRYLINHLNEVAKIRFNKSYNQLNDSEKECLLSGNSDEEQQASGEVIDILKLIVLSGFCEDDQNNKDLDFLQSESVAASSYQNFDLFRAGYFDVAI